MHGYLENGGLFLGYKKCSLIDSGTNVWHYVDFIFKSTGWVGCHFTLQSNIKTICCTHELYINTAIKIYIKIILSLQRVGRVWLLVITEVIGECYYCYWYYCTVSGASTELIQALSNMDKAKKSMVVRRNMYPSKNYSFLVA